MLPVEDVELELIEDPELVELELELLPEPQEAPQSKDDVSIVLQLVLDPEVLLDEDVADPVDPDEVLLPVEDVELELIVDPVDPDDVLLPVEYVELELIVDPVDPDEMLPVEVEVLPVVDVELELVVDSVDCVEVLLVLLVLLGYKERIISFLIILIQHRMKNYGFNGNAHANGPLHYDTSHMTVKIWQLNL